MTVGGGWNRFLPRNMIEFYMDSKWKTTGVKLCVVIAPADTSGITGKFCFEHFKEIIVKTLPRWHCLVLIFCHFFFFFIQTSGATRNNRLYRKQHWECTGQRAGGNPAIRKGKLLKDSETSTLQALRVYIAVECFYFLCTPFRTMIRDRSDSHQSAQQGTRIIWLLTICLFQETNSFQRAKLKDKLWALKNRL